jgi:beta-lactamase class A
MPLDVISQKFMNLEKSTNGRIGVSAIDLSNDNKIEYREHELFPFCSVAKLIIVAAILKKSESDPNLMNHKIMFSKADYDQSGYAPISSRYINNGMTIYELSKASIEHSDNLATNLLIKYLGGLKAINNYAKSIGDNIFRIDRMEPELNSSIPNDVRDTTSPFAMNRTMLKLTLGNELKNKQQKYLQTWLKNNTTGDLRIRKGILKGWVVADKTGTGKYGTTNDIGIIWPSKCGKPIGLSIFFTQNNNDAPKRDDIIAIATKIIIEEFSKKNQCLKF